MKRDVLTRADAALIAALPEGCKVTSRQLERWRQKGLIPDTTVERLGSGGTISRYPEGTAAQVIELVEILDSDRKLDHALLRLFLRKFPVDEAALKSLYLSFYGMFVPTARAGDPEMSPDDDEETDALAIAERAVDKAPASLFRTGLWRTVRARLVTRATRALHVDALVKSVITRLLTAFLSGELVDDYEGNAIAEIKAATGALRMETDKILGRGTLLPHLTDDEVKEMCTAVNLSAVVRAVKQASLADLAAARDQWVHIVCLLANLSEVARSVHNRRDIGGMAMIRRTARDELQLALFAPCWIVLREYLDAVPDFELDPLWDQSTPVGREYAEWYSLMARLARCSPRPLRPDALPEAIRKAPEDVRQAFNDWVSREDERIVLVG